MKTNTKFNGILAVFLIFLISIAPALAINEPTTLNTSDITRYTVSWQWTANTTWYNTSVYLDGAFVTNMTSPVTGTQVYAATGFDLGSSHTISLKSTDMSGNYSGWVNNTAITLSTGMDVSNITQNIDDLGTILGGIVSLLQVVIVDNIGIFITIIILIVLLYIIKRFGFSFSDFFKGILGSVFK